MRVLKIRDLTKEELAGLQESDITWKRVPLPSGGFKTGYFTLAIEKYDIVFEYWSSIPHSGVDWDTMVRLIKERVIRNAYNRILKEYEVE